MNTDPTSTVMRGEVASPSWATDDRGKPICIGDTVCVTYRNNDRGAQGWMERGKVVGYGMDHGRRVNVQFPSRLDTHSVGVECLRVVS